VVVLLPWGRGVIGKGRDYNSDSLRPSTAAVVWFYK